MSTVPTDILSTGMDQADLTQDTLDPASRAQETADVKHWLKRIKEDREFDKNARAAYAGNRRYARADRNRAEVAVPIALSYIDVLRSFLYAKNPDCSVTPSAFTEPPPTKEITAMVADQIAQGQAPVGPAMPNAIAKLLGGGMGPPPGPMPVPGAGPGGPPQDPADQDQAIQAKVVEIMKPYQRVRDDAKQFSQTLEIVVSYLWDKAKLKSQSKPMVNSALTVGVGWIKAVWLERMGTDPVMQGQINDIHDKLARMAETKRAMNAGEGDDDLLKAQLEQQAKALDAQSQIVIARGFAVDFVPAENIQVSRDCQDMSAYLDASYIAQQDFVPIEDARTSYPNLAKLLDKAKMYFPQPPRDTTAVNESMGTGESIRAEDAEYYRSSDSTNGQSLNTSSNPYVCIWEAWDRVNGLIHTMVEGVDQYAVEPYRPNPDTSRFYGFFQFQIGNVDGERHPRSLITRSEKLFDEYDRVRSAFAIHRRRVVPKTGFDASNMSAEDAKKIENGGVQEMIALKPLKPGTPVNTMLAPISYAPIDPSLYDTGPIRAELEMIWGVQEALSNSIHVAKTAREAEIAKEGSNSRTGYMRDDLDTMYDEFADYTAEVALQKMSSDDVREIAGPWALWPEGMTVDDLATLVTVTIDAGSTGRPDTAAQRSAWAALMPLLQQGIQQVGELRGSSKEEIADCIEELVVESINRSGDRTDAGRFMPDPPRTAPPPPPMPPPQPLDESALAGTQIQMLLAILVDVRAGAVSPGAANALIQACAPHIPPELVQQMVGQSTPLPTDPATQLDAPHASTVPPTPPLVPQPPLPINPRQP